MENTARMEQFVGSQPNVIASYIIRGEKSWDNSWDKLWHIIKKTTFVNGYNDDYTRVEILLDNDTIIPITADTGRWYDCERHDFRIWIATSWDKKTSEKIEVWLKSILAIRLIHIPKIPM